MQRTRIRPRLAALAARCLVLALAMACRSAAAYSIFQLDGAANAGYSESGAGTAESFTEVRPALTLSFVSPRVTWRAGYVFAGHLTLSQDRLLSMSNAVDLSMAAELSSRSALLVSGGISQGGTAFQLTRAAPEAGQPAFRAPTNPALVSATLTESYALETSERLHVHQALAGSLIAPQDALGKFNASVTASAGLTHQLRNEYGQRARDSFGAEVRSGGAVLRSSPVAPSEYWSMTNALVAHWNHDFTPGWTGQATGGVEQVLTFTGSYPLAILPTGSVTMQYTARNASGALTASYGATSDLQTGIVSVTQGAVLHGLVSFDTAYPRTLGASVGLLHAQPLGQSAARAAAGTGYAAQGDVGLSWGLSDSMVATARYAIAYQFDQPDALEPLLTHVVLVGLTMRYSSSRYVPPAPSLGGRVDGTDRTGFPEGGSRKP